MENKSQIHRLRSVEVPTSTLTKKHRRLFLLEYRFFVA